jgi:hypothetical protein
MLEQVSISALSCLIVSRSVICSDHFASYTESITATSPTATLSMLLVTGDDNLSHLTLVNSTSIISTPDSDQDHDLNTLVQADVQPC